MKNGKKIYDLGQKSIQKTHSILGKIKLKLTKFTTANNLQGVVRPIVKPMATPAREGLRASGYPVGAGIGAGLGLVNHLNRQQPGTSWYPENSSMAKSMFKGAMYGAGATAGLHSLGTLAHGGIPLGKVLTPAAKGLLLTGLGLAA